MVKRYKKIFDWLVPRFYLGGGSAPDPNAIASAQTQANNSAANYGAQLNRFNQYGPTGNVTWQNNGNGQWNQNTTLSPQEQQLFNTQLGTQNNLANQANQFAGNQLAQAANTQIPGANNQDFSTVSNALYGQISPWLQQNTNMLQTNLANQGLTPGTQAYNMAMMQNNQGNNQAMLGVIGDTTQQMGQLQSQAINKQNQALNMFSGLNSGSGSVQSPTFSGNSTAQGPAAANIGQYMYNNYNAKQAQKNNATQAVGQMGASAALMA